MREEWTGELVGKMHNAEITLDQMAEATGWSKSYISKLLTGARKTKGAREKLFQAFEEIAASAREGR